MDAILGIDFGSAVVRTAICREGAVEPMENRFTSRRLPRLVEWPAGSGEPAPGALPVRYRSVKQLAGGDLRPGEGPGPAGVADNLADLVRQVAEDARAVLGGAEFKAVLAVPGWLSERSRAMVREAALRAGMPAIRLFDDALAALLGSPAASADGTALVYALGAGSFSATVVRQAGGRGRVLAVEGHRTLGGDAFDAALVGLLLDRVDGVRGLAGRVDAALRLGALAEQVKIGLSRREQAEVDLDLSDLPGGRGSSRVTVSRLEFEQAIAAGIEDSLALVRRALREADVEGGAVDRILLVGGSTRLPLVERRLAQEYAAPRVRAGEGDVAAGAALRGGQLEDADWTRLDPGQGQAPVGPAALGGSGGWLALFSPRLQEAEALWGRGDREGAIAAFEAMLKEGRSYLGTLHHQAGQGLFTEGRYEEANRHLRQAVACDPTDRRAARAYHQSLGRRAVELGQAGRWQEAQEAIRQALAIHPRCAGCLETAKQIERVLGGGRVQVSVSPAGKKGKRR
jgi:tetratricopeptide (TPR) repeat protein